MMEAVPSSESTATQRHFTGNGILQFIGLLGDDVTFLMATYIP
jgi:hypothetical protein